MGEKEKIDSNILYEITIKTLKDCNKLEGIDFMVEENFITTKPDNYQPEPKPEITTSYEEDELDNFNTRVYQDNITQLALRVLIETFKFYLELATGRENIYCF